MMRIDLPNPISLDKVLHLKLSGGIILMIMLNRMEDLDMKRSLMIQ